jgi:hypothetical protein
MFEALIYTRNRQRTIHLFSEDTKPNILNAVIDTIKRNGSNSDFQRSAYVSRADAEEHATKIGAVVEPTLPVG